MKYKLKEDTKLHTHYSELKRCTSAKSTEQVVLERNHVKDPFHGEQMEFGVVRHSQWEKESKQTNETPSCFKVVYTAPLDFIEHAFAVEVFKDVVLHFRPDSVSLADQAIIDNKKIVGHAKKFKPDKQLLIYAYGLSLHGYRIKKRVYLCERWDKAGENILGYEKFEAPINMYDIATVRQWLIPRVKLLKATNDLFKKGLL